MVTLFVLMKAKIVINIFTITMGLARVRPKDAISDTSYLASSEFSCSWFHLTFGYEPNAFPLLAMFHVNDNFTLVKI